MKWIVITIYFGVIFMAPSKAYFDQDDEDDDFYAFIGQVGKENEAWVDPHNMLGDMNVGEEPLHSAETLKSIDEDTEEEQFGLGMQRREEKIEETSHLEEADDIHGLKDKLLLCQNEQRTLGEKLKVARERVKAQELEQLKDSNVDFKPFYTRIVFSLWNLLRLEEAQDVISDNDVLVRHMQARIDSGGISTLREYIGTKRNVHEVDTVIRNLFLEVQVGDESSNILDFLKSRWESVMTHLKDVQKWLYFLCITFLLLGVWACYLFIMDIQQELRWGRVIWMMIILIFVICCLWEWNHMHKVAEVRYRAKMAQRGFKEMPSECQPDHVPGWWVWTRVRLFGGPDPCEEYYEDLMMDPKDEVTPNKVISQTIAVFLVQPFESIGTHSAKFLTSFYSHIPIAYQAPATLLFLVLLVIVLFAVCGYGIEFPFWLGAIRPFYSPPTTSTDDSKEALDQLRKDRDAFLTESRTMLTDITRAALAQSQNNSQPVLITSHFLEERLETLVANHLALAMPHRTVGNSKGGAREGNLPLPNYDTVTSTPLHARRCMQKGLKDKVDGDKADVSHCTKDMHPKRDADGCLPSSSCESGNILRKRIVSTPKHSPSVSTSLQDSTSSASRKGTLKSTPQEKEEHWRDTSKNQDMQNVDCAFDEVGLDATSGSRDFYDQVSEIFDDCQRSAYVSDISQRDYLHGISAEESIEKILQRSTALRSLETLSSDDSSNDSFMERMKKALEE